MALSLTCSGCDATSAFRPDARFDGFGDCEFATTATALALMEQVETGVDERFGVVFPNQLQGTIQQANGEGFPVHAGLCCRPDHTRYGIEHTEVCVVGVVVWPCEQGHKVGVLEPVLAFLEPTLEGVVAPKSLLDPVLFGERERESRIASRNKILRDRLHTEAP